MHTNSTVLLVGNGRLAKHLKYWNQLVQTPNQILVWNREQSQDLLKTSIQQASYIWLAISDSAIVNFYNQHLSSANKTVVHFSGALHDERLLSTHPLMTFSNELFDKSVYEKIHFTITGADNLQTALPHFTNSFSQVSFDNKSLYHALCVLTGNFPQLLWNETLKEFRNLNIPDAAVETYIQQVAANFIQQKEKALTGPLVRKDLKTIESNLQSLTTKPVLKDIYNNFNENFGALKERPKGSDL